MFTFGDNIKESEEIRIILVQFSSHTQYPSSPHCHFVAKLCGAVLVNRCLWLSLYLAVHCVSTDHSRWWRDAIKGAATWRQVDISSCVVPAKSAVPAADVDSHLLPPVAETVNLRLGIISIGRHF